MEYWIEISGPGIYLTTDMISAVPSCFCVCFVSVFLPFWISPKRGGWLCLFSGRFLPKSYCVLRYHLLFCSSSSTVYHLNLTHVWCFISLAIFFPGLQDTGAVLLRFCVTATNSLFSPFPNTTSHRALFHNQRKQKGEVGGGLPKTEEEN